MTTYGMQALENYDAATAAEWANSTQPNYLFMSKQYVGDSFDFARRKIMYTMAAFNGVLDPFENCMIPNPTGRTLWSGQSAVGPSGEIAALDNVFNGGTDHFFFIMEKDIDTGVVVAYPAYSALQSVPVGIGAGGIATYATAHGAVGSDVTNEHLALSGGSGSDASVLFSCASGVVTKLVVNYLGQGYTATNSLTCTSSGGTSITITVSTVNTGSDGTWGRFVIDGMEGVTGDARGDVAAIVNPYNNDFWVRLQSCELYYFPHAASFAQTISPLFPELNSESTLEPLGFTANWVYVWEINFFHLTPYPQKLHIVSSTVTAPEIAADSLLSTYDYDYPNNAYYFRHIVGSDGNLYVYGNAVSGTRAYKLWKVVPATGFSDITPWSGSNGPNTDCANYTVDGFGNVGRYAAWKNYIVTLPATSQLGLISKLYPQDSVGRASPFRVDLTYYDINAATFDYHEGIVTQYMTAAWTSTVIGSATYQVVDFHEFNHYLDQTDKVYTGVDYTVRRFGFLCVLMSGGSPVDGNDMLVFVDYKFTYGSPPVVVGVLPETGWDNAYPDYANSIGQNEVVAGSMPRDSFDLSEVAQDTYLLDYTTGDMFLSGDSWVFCRLNPAFANRETQVAAMFGAAPTTSAAASPFMRLSFGVGFTQGHIF